MQLTRGGVISGVLSDWGCGVTDHVDDKKGGLSLGCCLTGGVVLQTM